MRRSTSTPTPFDGLRALTPSRYSLQLIAMTLVACTTGSPASSAPSVGATASPSATPSINPPTPSAGPALVTPTMVDVAGAIRLDVRPFADWVSVTEGSAWVAVGRAVKHNASGNHT